MDHFIARARVTNGGRHMVPLLPRAGEKVELGADGVTVAARADESQLEPVVLGRRSICEQNRWAIKPGRHHVNPAVAIEICKRSPAKQPLGAKLLGRKYPCRRLAKHQAALP